MAFSKEKMESDLKIGKKGEKHVLKMLTDNNIESVLNKEKKKFADYDIEAKIGRTKFTLEVKYDLYAAKSQNIAIEYFNPSSDKPSGVDSTKADLWSHIVTEEKELQCWLTSVKALKKFIKTTKPFKKIEKAGDGNASLYLYKISVIFPAIFYNINDYTEVKLKKLIKTLLK